MNKLLVILCLFYFTLSLKAQDGIILNSEAAFQGYTLIENFTQTFLVDNCGDIVNEWNLRSTNNHPKLLPNGNLVYIKNNQVHQRDWNDNVVSSVGHNNPNLILEYEVIVLPNGNYLCIARTDMSQNFFFQLGYNPDLGNPSYDDTIVEIDSSTGEIVWEWRISDHVIQQRDSTLANYGILTENPQLLNVDAISTVDWSSRETFMINGFDYNPELDQIVLSVRKISEIVIIDHSTTTEEAKGSTGGRYGKGGDILYRWGNPENYQRVQGDQRILYFQHNPNWIKYGPHKDKMIIYSNGLDRPDVSFNDQYSTVEIVSPDINSDGSYNKNNDMPFLPTKADISYSGESLNFFSDYTSGATVLPNGNIYLTVGEPAELIELDSTGNRVWQFNIERATYIFRSEKYPLDYPAFDDKILTPSGTIESPPSPFDCTLFTTSIETIDDITFGIKVSTQENAIEIESSEKQFEYLLLNINGQILASSKNKNFYHHIETSHLQSGIYFIRYNSGQSGHIQKVFIK